jgi:hypothetical protein
MASSDYAFRERTIVKKASLVLLFLLTGCGAGVAPYERGKIAHWSMTTSDLTSPAEAHARAIHEGATGGGFEAGGGCGCN